MTLQEIIELVQQHHPDMGETEVVKLINRGMEDFSVRTEMVTGTFTFPTVINQRYYTLSDDILKIDEVYYDASAGGGKRIPRLSGKPEEMDRG